MLAISARFTPSMCKRFGRSNQASEFFAEIAHIMIADEMWETSLENAQAFFLLGMADWGKGDRARSSINMGIAVRMAGVLRLHREETYRLPANASATDVVHAERARRTFWVIQNHDNLYTQQHLPASFAKSDITTLLPSSENDFAFGRVPRVRAALAGTKPAQQDPSLVSLPSRSLFATLVQAHDFWGTIARDFYKDGDAGTGVEVQPWSHDSRYRKITESLRQWEQNMPPDHRWSAWNLRGFKVEHVELAYLSIVSIMKLNHIVLRRLYLERIVARVLDPSKSNDDAPQGFWEQMSFDLFSNVWELYEIIDAFFSTRSSDDGFPAMLAFCVYICGSLSSYLVKWPQLCRELSSSADKILERTLEILSTLEGKWPTVSEWTLVLRKLLERQPTRPNEQFQEISSQEAFLTSTASISQSPGAAVRHVPRPFPETPVEDSGKDSAREAHAPADLHLQQRRYSGGNGNNKPPSQPVMETIPPLNSLQLLSDAATLGAGRRGIQSGEPFLHTRQETMVASADAAYSAHHPHAPMPSHASQDFSLPDFANFEMLQESIENDMTDFVHGYVHLGWSDWQA